MDATTAETVILHRLHRLQGQIDGLIRMYEQDRPAIELLDQIAAIRGALAGVGLELVSHDLAARLDGAGSRAAADDPCVLIRHLLHTT